MNNKPTLHTTGLVLGLLGLAAAATPRLVFSVDSLVVDAISLFGATLSVIVLLIVAITAVKRRVRAEKTSPPYTLQD